MSRCFPFPPPGYEIKASPDNVNLISKEKHKPKKHKEKKDKDKKERSEKKEKKDRSEGKHKDDRKQKKKDKQEKKTEKCVADDSKSTDGMQDYRILVELGKRVRNDDGATTDNRTLGKIAVVEQKHELITANGHTPKVEANGSINGFHGKFCGDGIEKRNELKEKKENGNSVGEGKNEDRDKKREEKKRKKERKKEKKMEKEKKQTKVKESSKENVKQTENNGNALYNNNNNNPSDHLKESLDGWGNIPKQEKRAMNGVLHDNGFRPNTPTLRAVVEKVSPVTNQKIDVITNHVEKGAVITNQKIDGVITNGKINGKLSSSQLMVENNHSTSHNGKIGSNNHATSNGNSTNPTNVKPNSEPIVENGRKLDNGALDGKTSTSSRPLSVSVKARKEKEKKVKKPNHHPDLKYLSQILTVPKVDPPRFDDQDWLFGYKAKRPKLGSESTHKHVWAEAIELGAADIIALPYVIPY
ncbi:hypothetical protein ABFX02_04G221200 [Erythranthe guttata]